MPKGISRNPRTDLRRKKNRTSTTTPTGFVEVGPPMTFQQAMNSVTALTNAATDSVNHPPHYTVGGIETIDFIEAKQLNYHLGQVIKYVTRAEHKNNFLEDLKKAQWYLNREIENRSKT